MAMNGNTLGDAIAAAITDSSAPADVKAQVKTLWEKIGTEIVNHIKANAMVMPGIAVSTPAGAGSTTSPGQIQ